MEGILVFGGGGCRGDGSETEGRTGAGMQGTRVDDVKW